MRILVAAERLGHAGGMERYLEIVLPALAAAGATVHAIARAVDAVPHGITAQQIAWADEHDAPSGHARLAMQHAIADFAPDVAVAHNVMDAGVVEALRAAPRLAYHAHDHRPFCPNGDRMFPRSARICALPIGRACAVHSLTDGCGYGPRRRTLTLIGRRGRMRDAVAAADAIVVASSYMADIAARNGIEPARVHEVRAAVGRRRVRRGRTRGLRARGRFRGPRRAPEGPRRARARGRNGITATTAGRHGALATVRRCRTRATRQRVWA